MSKTKSTVYEDTGPHQKPTTQEGQESLCIALAYDLVEDRLRHGTATSQETTHFLKMGSSKERREAELDAMRIEVLKAKAEAMESLKRVEAMYQDAINAVRSYTSPATLGPVEDRHD